ARGVGGDDLLGQVPVDERPLLQATSHGSLPLPAADDESAGDLAPVARLEALVLLAPRAHRETSAGGATFPAAVRVVYRVHGATALVRLAAHPTLAAGLADDDVLVLGVADRAHGGVAVAVDAPELAGGHANGHVGAVAA